MPQLTALDIESLAQVDAGALAVAFKREMMRMSRDIIDRPKNKRKRTVSLRITGTALTDEDGQLRGVAIECELVPVKIPNYVTYPQRAKATMNGVEFDPADPDGVNQNTLSSID